MACDKKETEVNYDLIIDRAEQKFNRIKNLATLLKTLPANDKYRKEAEQNLGAELASSIGSQVEDLTELQNEQPYYHYTGRGSCWFEIEGVKFNVADLRDMRKDPYSNTELHYDICIIVCDLKRLDEPDGLYQYFILPEYLYGSSTEDFNVNKPVHKEFIEAATEFIKENGGAEALRKRQEESNEDKENRK